MAGRSARGGIESPFERRNDRAVYVISVAAELSGMHPQTLRIYERKGLLDPARTDGGSRRYSQDDIDRLRRIQELTNLGIGLEGVKRIMALEAEIKDLKDQMQALQEQSKVEKEKIHKHYRRDLVPLSQAVVLFRGAIKG